MEVQLREKCHVNYHLKSPDYKVTYVIRKGAYIYYEKQGEHYIMAYDCNHTPTHVVYFKLSDVKHQENTAVFEEEEYSINRKNMPFERTPQFTNLALEIENLERNVRALTGEREELTSQYQRLNELYELEKNKAEQERHRADRLDEISQGQLQDLEKAKRRSDEHFNARQEESKRSKRLSDENMQLYYKIDHLNRRIEEQNIEISLQRREAQAMHQEIQRLRERIMDWDRVRSPSRT